MTMTPSQMRERADSLAVLDKRYDIRDLWLAVAEIAEEGAELGRLHDSSTRNRVALQGELGALRKEVAALRGRLDTIRNYGREGEA